jgi:hypothetical protein
LASWRERGTVASNMPRSVAADAIAHQYHGAGHISGTGAGAWPWLFSFPCKKRHGIANCINAVGDAHRYGKPPLVR